MDKPLSFNEMTIEITGDDVQKLLSISLESKKPNCILWDGEVARLEELTEEDKQNYYKEAAWDWVKAIYILQGYKPVFQVSTEQVRSHFPSQVAYVSQSIQLGNIGKEINQAGEKNFIDSPEKWLTFWQKVYLPKQEAQPFNNDSVVTNNQKAKNTEETPLFIKDPRDPEPKYVWYTPARYFARQLVEDDSTLLTKREILAAKVVQSFNSVGIKKRGDKPFLPGTILKAFSNVNLSKNFRTFDESFSINRLQS